jgi:hypothetical protein
VAAAQGALKPEGRGKKTKKPKTKLNQTKNQKKTTHLPTRLFFVSCSKDFFSTKEFSLVIKNFLDFK